MQPGWQIPVHVSILIGRGLSRVKAMGTGTNTPTWANEVT